MVIPKKLLVGVVAGILLLALALPVLPTKADGSIELTSWEKDSNNPLVDPGDNRVWPAMVYANDQFHLYLGHWSKGSDITYRTSSDGKNFTEYGNSPVITCSEVKKAWNYDAVALEPHSIIWWDSEWRMYLGAKADSTWVIGYATSGDLIDWTLSDSPCLWPSAIERTVADPHAVVYGDEVYLYYASYAAGISAWGMCGAVSSDGTNFKKFGGYIKEATAPVEAVVLPDGILLVTIDLSEETHPYMSMWTTNGKDFGDYSTDPVLEQDVSISWESVNLAHGAIVKADSTYWLYYGAKDSSGNYQIGRASTGLGSETPVSEPDEPTTPDPVEPVPPEPDPDPSIVLGPPLNLSATFMVNLDWNKAVDADKTLVRGSTNSYPEQVTDGELVYFGTGDRAVFYLPENCTVYYISLWSYDLESDTYSEDYGQMQIK